jgi:hypothetical protein
MRAVVTGADPPPFSVLPAADGVLLALGAGAARSWAQACQAGQLRFGPPDRAGIVAGLGLDQGDCLALRCPQPGDEGLFRLQAPADDLTAASDAVLEFCYRPAAQAPVDLEGFPVLRCLGRDRTGNRGWPVLIELRARGPARSGVYALEVTSGKAIVGAGGSGWPQTAWVHYVLARVDAQVALYAGRPGAETRLAVFPDLDPEGAIDEILLGNAGDGWACGCGLWDAVRLGHPLRPDGPCAGQEP